MTDNLIDLHITPVRLLAADAFAVTGTDHHNRLRFLPVIAQVGKVLELLKRYPSNKIVLAHWGGGIFFYMMMKREVRETLSNVWFDTAASPYLYIPEIYSVAGEIMGFDKILFGSDYPLLKPERYFKEMASVNQPPASIQKIKGENASELLRLRWRHH